MSTFKRVEIIGSIRRRIGLKLYFQMHHGHTSVCSKMDYNIKFLFEGYCRITNMKENTRQAYQSGRANKANEANQKERRHFEASLNTTLRNM